jgi:hypothetical protein
MVALDRGVVGGQHYVVYHAPLNNVGVILFPLLFLSLLVFVAARRLCRAAGHHRCR